MRARNWVRSGFSAVWPIVVKIVLAEIFYESVDTATRPQQALSLFGCIVAGLLSAELADGGVSLSEFETAVLEEQVRDARFVSLYP
jgi:hypothetical protein